MAGINKVILIGNLGKDPDVMTFENGVKKASFPLATTESYRDKDGNWVDQTEWHNVVLWRWLAEKNLIKGDQVYVEGRLRTRSWEDSEGKKHYITEVYADKLLKLTRRETGTGGYAQPPADDIQTSQTPSPQTETPAPSGLATSGEGEATTSSPDASAPDDDLPF